MASDVKAMVRAIEAGTLSKRKAILELGRDGMKTGDIAKAIGIRYQFAYNVLNSGAIGGPSMEERRVARIAKLEEQLRTLKGE